MIGLADSYDYCHQVMRRAARNFYYGMKLLPPAKARAMFALYAFMRAIDDIGDDETQSSDERRRRLEEWRGALRQGRRDKPVASALLDTLRRFSIPLKLLEEAIDGQLQDLEQKTYATFEELYRYCYRVASTVGIAAVYIWGFRDEAAVKLAEWRGIAMQLTNILRDLREDETRGRRYLPANEFPFPVAAGAFVESMRFQIARAREYYDRSAPLEELISADARPTLRIMTAIYRGILERIAVDPAAVLRGRVSLSGGQKIKLVVQHAWRGATEGLA